MKKFFLLLIPFFCFCQHLVSSSEEQASHQIIRAAFDLGSGSFKVLVSEVDGDLVRRKFSRVISVELGFDLAASKDMKFSANGWQNALNSLKQLVDDAKREGATQFAGVATAAFRRARNGVELLEYLNDQLGINLRLISQEEEGILGFETAMTLSPEFSKQNSLVLDLGAGSLQLTAYDKNEYSVFLSQVGVSQIVKQFFEEIRKTPYLRETHFDPITAEEVVLVMKLLESQISFPAWLKAKRIEGVQLVMCSDTIPQFQSDTGKQDVITKDDIKHVLFNVSNRKDLLKPRERMAFTIAYTLLYRILLDLDLDQFVVKEVTSGCAAGLMKDERFWSHYKQGLGQGTIHEIPLCYDWPAIQPVVQAF